MNGRLRKNIVLSETNLQDIQSIRNHRTYLDDGPYIIDQLWTYDKVMQQLRAWFPKVFAYLDKHQEKSQSNPVLLQWCLLRHPNKSFEIMLITKPNRMHIFENKGRLKASVKGSHLWFGELAASYTNRY
jgi:hypothetical protein